MKAGVTPILTAAWWKANKATLVSANPLEAALKKYETSKAAFEKATETPNTDGYAAYMAAKQVLSADVLKAVETTIGACNKTLHKDDIAGLTKYKTAIIPAEKTKLDKDFNTYKGKHEGAFNTMVAGMNNFLKALEPIAALSAKTVLDCEAAAPGADKALADATKAKGNAVLANTAMSEAMTISAGIAKKHQELSNAIKAGPKDWGYDKTKISASDSAAINKLSDRKSMMEAQIENNFNKVAEINKTVQNVMSKTRQVATGSAQAEDVLKGAFDRLVNRAFALVQSNDVPAREMKAALSNLEGDITAYGKAEAKDKPTHKKRAEDNLRMAKVQGTALQNALQKGKAEIDTTLKNMPADIVNRGSKVFGPLFLELDKATKAFGEDAKVLTAGGEKIKKLEVEVGKLT